MLGKVAGSVGSVDEERDNRNKEECERSAIRLAAALAGHSPHAAKVERDKKSKKRGVGKTETHEDPDENREHPARLLPGAGIRNQERRSDKRPRGIKRK